MAGQQTKSGVSATDILTNYTFGTLKTIAKINNLSGDYVFNKLRGQEDEIERELGILWQAQRIRSEPPVGATDFDLIEPAYDYETNFFYDNRWGFLKLRRYPVRSVERMVFTFPNPDSAVFTVPPDWMRIDHEFGSIRLVPTSAAIYGHFSAFMLSLFSGGRSVPASIVVDYTAGFRSGTLTVPETLSTNYADLLEHLKQSVIADILMDAFVPGSLSISADGESQSMTLDIQRFIEGHKEKRRMFKNKIKGVILTVV